VQKKSPLVIERRENFPGGKKAKIAKKAGVER